MYNIFSFFILLVFLPNFGLSQSSDVLLYLNKKQYEPAFELIKSDYYKIVENIESTSIYTITKWIETYEIFNNRIECKSTETGWVEETGADVQCMTRLILQSSANIFAIKIYQTRAGKKVEKEDYKGAISDLEKALSMVYSDDNEKQILFYRLGILYLATSEPAKGCEYLRKSGDYGNEDAYEMIRKYCN